MCLATAVLRICIILYFNYVLVVNFCVSSFIHSFMLCLHVCLLLGLYFVYCVLFFTKSCSQVAVNFEVFRLELFLMNVQLTFKRGDVALDVFWIRLSIYSYIFSLHQASVGL